jgi:hypothetical protein
MIKDYRYVYNPAQAEFYIKNGLIPIAIGNHKKTKNMFFKFKDSAYLQTLYHEWINRKHKN